MFELLFYLRLSLSFSFSRVVLRWRNRRDLGILLMLELSRSREGFFRFKKRTRCHGRPTTDATFGREIENVTFKRSSTPFRFHLAFVRPLMSLVRSHYLRSSSKWRIHLLHFFARSVRGRFLTHLLSLLFTTKHQQNVYEPLPTRFRNTPITHSPDSEAKNDENDFAFAITAKVLLHSAQDEKTASLDAFKKVDSNVKLFGSTIEARKWTRRKTVSLPKVV